MSDPNSLHLPDLTIKGFRGIDELTIPRLGRVTLLVGKNGVGKTTVLEAIQTYASRAHPAVLRGILARHGELLPVVDDDGREAVDVDWEALFHNRQARIGDQIRIGPSPQSKELAIKLDLLRDPRQAELTGFTSNGVALDPPKALYAVFNLRETIVASWPRSPYDVSARGPLPDSRDRTWPRRRGFSDDSMFHHGQTCELLGPDLISNVSMAQYWDTVAMAGYEERAVAALRLIFGDAVQDVVMVGRQPARSGGPRAFVRFNEQERRIPLNSLGDGAIRLFGIALALANCRNGFLLIDEAENGIYRSLHRDFWRMVLETAERNNVQVVATTHGSDSDNGFARAAAELDQIDGLLMRLDRERGYLRAVNYSKEGLLTAAEQGIEVR